MRTLHLKSGNASKLIVISRVILHSVSDLQEVTCTTTRLHMQVGQGAYSCSLVPKLPPFFLLFSLRSWKQKKLLLMQAKQ